jgi:hypothetical protein
MTRRDACGRSPCSIGRASTFRSTTCGWSATVRPLDGDGALVAGLQRYGITVARTDVQPVFVTLGDSGLVDEPVDPATPAPGRGRAGSRPRTRR